MKNQVFTPETVVVKMLNLINYKNNLIGKRILESSFGQGNILLIIVEEYIREALRKGIEQSRIVSLLERDIYGIELEKIHFQTCLKKLNDILTKYNIPEVRWNLYNSDALKFEWHCEFDLILGNPPYIKYHDINLIDRSYLRDNYLSCKSGNFDYYYAFLENDFNLLSTSGRLVYLIPNNVFKNVFADNLRKIIKKSLESIYDFTSTKVFDGILTTSAIITLNKCNQSEDFLYYDVKNDYSKNIKKSAMHGKWLFQEKILLNEDQKFFGDYYNAQMGVATLLNKAFILSDFIEEDDYYIKENRKIEKEIVRIAVSPKSLYYGHQNRIIFPYKIEETIEKYSDEEINKNFPYTIDYLQTFIESLKSRKIGKNVKWFEYGRTQGLSAIKKSRLLVSTLVTKKMKVYRVNPSVVIYSGISIHAKNNNSLDIAKKILESDEFFNYVKNIGVNTNSDSYRISAKDINLFPIPHYILKEDFNGYRR